MTLPSSDATGIFSPNFRFYYELIKAARSERDAATAAVIKATNGLPLREAMKRSGPLQQALREARARYNNALQESSRVEDTHPDELKAYEDWLSKPIMDLFFLPAKG